MSMTIPVAESVLKHYKSQSERLRNSSLKITPDHLSRHGSLENYLAECFLYQDTEEHMYEFLQDTFDLNTEVLHLAFKLISNELDYICTDEERCEQINAFAVTKFQELDESKKGGEV